MDNQPKKRKNVSNKNLKETEEVEKPLEVIPETESDSTEGELCGRSWLRSETETATVSAGSAVKLKLKPVSGGETLGKLVQLAELRIYNGAQLAKELGMPVHHMRKLAKDNNYIIPKADKVSKHKPKIMALYNLGITRAVICKVLGISYVIVQAAVGSENPSIYEELTREGAIERAEALIAALRD